MSQMNLKEVFHNTAYSVQLPYIAFNGHSLQRINIVEDNPVFISWKGGNYCNVFPSIY